MYKARRIFTSKETNFNMKSLIIIIIIGLYIIKRDFPVKVTLSLLLIVVILSSNIIRIWKRYFVIFVFVGGIIVIIIYLSSLRSYLRETSNSFIIFILLGYFFIEERREISSWSSWTLLDKNTLDFWISLIIIFIVCFFASQLLISRRRLRSL